MNRYYVLKIFHIAESSLDAAKPELSCLFPDDCGLGGETTNFGRAYWWAAQLAGLDDLEKGQTLANFVSDLVKRIKVLFEMKCLKFL